MIIASIGSAFGALMIVALLFGLFVAGGWVAPEIFRGLGWSRLAPPPEPAPRRAEPLMRAPEPKAPLSPRKKVIEAIKGEVEKPVPFNPEERLKAAKRQMAIIIIGAALYAASPLDAAPALLLGPIGGIDDLAVMVMAFMAARKEWVEAKAEIEAMKLSEKKAG